MSSVVTVGFHYGKLFYLYLLLVSDPQTSRLTLCNIATEDIPVAFLVCRDDTRPSLGQLHCPIIATTLKGSWLVNVVCTLILS